MLTALRCMRAGCVWAMLPCEFMLITSTGARHILLIGQACLQGPHAAMLEVVRLQEAVPASWCRQRATVHVTVS